MTHKNVTVFHRLSRLTVFCVLSLSCYGTDGDVAVGVTTKALVQDPSPSAVETLFGSTLAEYWDARTGVSASNGHVVSWTGLKNGSVLSAPTNPANQPVFGADGTEFGGAAVVQTSVADGSYLSGPLAPTLLAAGARPYIAIVHRSRSLSQGPARYLDATSPDTNTRLDVSADQGSTRGMYCPDWPNGGCQTYVGTNDELLRPVVSELWVDSDGLHHAQDGQEDTVSTGNVANQALVRAIEQVVLGALPGGSQLSDTNFAQVVITSSVPSAEQREAYREYAMYAWSMHRCGDGFLSAEEQCDDGNSNNTDSCSNTCVATAPVTSTPAQVLGSSVVEWWDARVGVGSISGGVTTWRGQQNGTLLNTGVPSSAHRPSLATDTGFFHDRPVVQSSIQNNAFLSGTLSPTLLPLSSRPYVAVVHRSRALSTASETFTDVGSSDRVTTRLNLFTASSSAQGLYCPNWPAVPCQYYLDSNNQRTSPILTELWVDATGTHYAEDGVESSVTSGSADQSLLNVLERISVGAIGSTDQLSDHDFAQIVLASSTPSAEPRVQYLRYACAEWGLPGCAADGLPRTGTLCNPAESECGFGRECRAGIGVRFGRSASDYVCWDPECDDAQSNAFVCGSVAAHCGTCPECSSNCAGKTCGKNDCGVSCGPPCSAGGLGCESSLDCASGLVCGVDNGALFGGPSNLRACWAPECESLHREDIPCGSTSSTCGLCRACVAHCEQGSCGDDGCGGSCGSCAAGSSCDANTGLCMQSAQADRYPLPAGLTVTTAGVGTLDDSWRVTPAGNLEYSIPLQVPPGRGGIQPELTLQYSSDAGNGMLGMGWGLSGLSAVTRCNKTIARDGIAEAPKFDAFDAFCLDGQRLVAVGQPQMVGSDAATIEYRTEPETFTRVTASFSVANGNYVGPSFFNAEAKDGRIFTYAAGIPGNDKVLIPGVLLPTPMQAWALSRVADRAGNGMDVRYVIATQETENGIARDYYPRSISYSDGIVLSFVYNFDDAYHTRRLDDASGWRNGVLLKRDALLQRVSVAIDDEWVRHYELTYDPPSATAPHTLLRQVQDCAGGSSPSTGVCKPPTVLSYTESRPGLSTAALITDAQSPARIETAITPVTLDLNGDGFDDVLYGTSIDGGGLIDPAVVWRWYAVMSEHHADGSVGHNLIDTGLVLGYESLRSFFDFDSAKVGTAEGAVFDWDNDGRQDFLESSVNANYAVVSYDGTTFHRYAPGIPQARSLGDNGQTRGQSYLLDLNGDRFKDLLVCDWTSDGARWRMYLHKGGATSLGGNNNTGGFVEGDRQDLQVDAPCLPGAVVIDTDGDGAYELLMPRGDFGKSNGYLLSAHSDGSVAVVVTNAVAGDLSGVPTVGMGIRVLDMNGDGLSDVVRYDVDFVPDSTAVPGTVKLRIQLSLGNGRFAVHEQSLVVDDQPFSRDFAYVRAAMSHAFAFDFDLDGKEDLAFPVEGGLTGARSDGRTLTRMQTIVWDSQEGSDPGLGSATTFVPVDVNGDGVLGLLRYGNFKERQVGRSELLNAVVDGLGAPTTFGYGPLSDPANYRSDLFDGARALCHAPFYCAHPRFTVATKVAEFDAPLSVLGVAPVPSRSYRYAYAGWRADAQGHAPLGFAETSSQRLSALGGILGQKTVSYHNTSYDSALHVFPEAWEPYHIVETSRVNEAEFDASTTTVADFGTDETIEYDRWPTALGGLATHEKVHALVQFRQQVGSSTREEQVSETHTTLEMDLFGNVLRRQSQLGPRDTRLIERDFKHLHEDSFKQRWLISLPISETDQYTVLAPNPDDKSRVRHFDYYQNSGLLFERITDPNGPATHRTEYRRGSSGLVDSILDQATGEPDRLTTFHYDDRRLYPTSITNALNQTSQVEYSRRTGQIEAIEDANTLVSQSRTDGFGRPALELGPSGQTSRVEYSYVNELTPLRADVTSNLGEHTQADFDVRGREVAQNTSATFGKTLVQYISYDPDGHVSEVTRPTETALASGAAAAPTSYRYDSFGRLRQVTLPDGIAQSCYDARTTCSTNPRGYTQCVTHDERDRVSAIFEPVFAGCRQTLASFNPLGPSTLYRYGAFGAPAQVEDQAGLVTSMQSDVWNRPTHLADPDTGSLTTAYNGFGEIKSTLDANQQLVELTHDVLGRLTRRTATGGNAAAGGEINEFIFDGGETRDLAEGELFGRLTETRSADAANQRYRYDPSTGDLTGLVEQRSVGTFETTFHRTLGRIDRVNYPQGTGVDAVAVQYEYDANGPLRRVRDALTPNAAPIWELSDTDEHGSPKVESYGNGFLQGRSYDPSGRLAGTTQLNPQAAAVLQLSFHYDANGNIDQQHDLTRTQSESFTYDAHDRLENVTQGAQTKTYSYHPTLGNLQVGSTFSYDFSTHPHAVSADTVYNYSYDNAGNRLIKEAVVLEASGGSEKYTYAPNQKPRRIWNQHLEGSITNDTAFRYDALDNRASKQTVSEEIQYLSNGLYERRKSNSGSEQHVYSISAGSRIVAQRVLQAGQAPRTLYLHDDARGTPRLISNSAGAVEQELDYTAFGSPRNADWSSSTTPINIGVSVGFTGHEPERERSLVNMQGRIYDPSVAQFLTPDPIVQRPISSTGINRYAYVFHNPLTYVDPSGYQEVDPGSPSVGEPIPELEAEPMVVIGIRDRAEQNDVNATVGLRLAGVPLTHDSPLQGRSSPTQQHETSDSPYRGQQAVGPHGEWARSRALQQSAEMYQPLVRFIVTQYAGGAIANKVFRALGAGVTAIFARFGSRAGEEVAAAGASTALAQYWPANNGFLGATTRRVLETGEVIDRYGGSAFSRFFSPAGTPLAARAIPPDTAGQALRTFKVLKAFEVEAGTVAPAFGQLGLGTQFRAGSTLSELIEQGYIQEVLP